MFRNEDSPQTFIFHEPRSLYSGAATYHRDALRKCDLLDDPDMREIRATEERIQKIWQRSGAISQAREDQVPVF